MGVTSHLLTLEFWVVILSIGALAWALIVTVNAKNPLEWWHFISSRGEDGKHYADIDKLGKAVGIVVGSGVVIGMTYTGKMTSDIFFVYLSFVGAIAGWSAYLRSKNGELPTKPPKE